MPEKPTPEELAKSLQEQGDVSIYYKIGCFTSGAMVLSVCSIFQKIIIGAPLVLKGYLVPALFGGVAGMLLGIYISRLKKVQIELKRLNQDLEDKVKQRTAELEKSLAEVKQLNGLLPICSFCKKIRDDEGYWNQIEDYIKAHSDVAFSHSICQECAKKHYPDLDLYDD
jgi:hypothetical protein